MNDMAKVIEPKSDQLNADDLIVGPMTIKVTGVTIRAGQEQPISIHFEGDNGKPYKCCKSMARVLVTAWGPDSKKYVGRSMTLYRDPKVRWGGMDVGGIRISHMSDINESLTMALTATRQSRKPFTVQPLKGGERKAEAQGVGQATADTSTSLAPSPAASAPNGGPTDADIVKDVDHWIGKRKFQTAADLARSIKDDALKQSTIERIQDAYVRATNDA